MDSLSGPAITQQAVYFKGACYSLAHLSFPSGAFWRQQVDIIGGGWRWDTVYFSPNSPVVQSIPCNDACCKVTFTNDVETVNGQTTHTVRALYYESDGTCEMQPLPDYNLYPKKFEAKIWDPMTLSYQTITGQVMSQDPCELTCPQFCPAWIPDPDARPTGIGSNAPPIEFSVRPTLVDNFVRFTSNKPITRVVAYDMTGRMVLNVERLNNNELDASGLTKGPYIIKVHFEGNETRTVKILKQ